jgi:folate-binding protein YgfZ
MLDVEAAEEAFARSVAAVVVGCDVVEVDGPDAATYLQGQLSQEIEGLRVGSSTMALLLQPQGKIEAWVRVTRLGPERFWLDVDAGFGEVVLARLQRFKLRVAIELRLLSEVPLVAVRGPDAAAGSEALGFSLAPDVVEVDWVAGAARGAGPGFDLIGPDVAVPAGLPLAGPEALDALRIGLGLPAMGRELDGSTIPAAAGIVEDSVSFTKGCYVGQELVARLDSRGSNTPTNLRGLRLSRPADLPDQAAILVGDQDVGRLTSYAAHSRRGPIALGYLKRSVPAPSAATVVDRAGESVAVDVVPLPFP